MNNFYLFIIAGAVAFLAFFLGKGAILLGRYCARNEDKKWVQIFDKILKWATRIAVLYLLWYFAYQVLKQL